MSDSQILIGAEFEFIFKSEYNPITNKKTIQKLEDSIGCPININPWIERKSHTEKDSMWTLEDECSLPSRRGAELVSPPLPVDEFKRVCPIVLNVINEIGRTTNRCGLHINISADKSCISPLKLIDSIDENEIWKYFNKRVRSKFGGSVRKLLSDVIENTYIYPNTNLETELEDTLLTTVSKRYGVNVSKMAYGYIEFRYIGGKDYHKKWDKISEIIDLYLNAIENAKSKENIESKVVISALNKLRKIGRWDICGFFKRRGANIVNVKKFGSNFFITSDSKLPKEFDVLDAMYVLKKRYEDTHVNTYVVRYDEHVLDILFNESLSLTEIVKRLIDIKFKYPDSITSLFYTIVRRSDFESFKLLWNLLNHKIGNRQLESIVSSISYSANQEMFDFVCSERKLNSTILRTALHMCICSSHDASPIIKYILKKNIRLNRKIVEKAVDYNNRIVLDYLRSNNMISFIKYGVTRAMRKNKFEIASFLLNL